MAVPRSRRQFLLRCLGGVVLLCGGYTLWRIFLPPHVGRRERRTLAALLDTLIPDGEFPGARRTGVLEPLIAECEATRQTRRALVEGLALLDRWARRRGARSFADLAADDRDAAVSECATAARESLPWFFFRTVRDGAMRLHYAHPLAWKAVGLMHAPQPQGYLDYEQAPTGA